MLYYFAPVQNDLRDCHKSRYKSGSQYKLDVLFVKIGIVEKASLSPRESYRGMHSDPGRVLRLPKERSIGPYTVSKEGGCCFGSKKGGINLGAEGERMAPESPVWEFRHSWTEVQPTAAMSDAPDGDSECSASCGSEMTSISRRILQEAAQQPTVKHSSYTQM
eukprot:2736423-Rhodomonas_salina.3